MTLSINTCVARLISNLMNCNVHHFFGLGVIYVDLLAGVPDHIHGAKCSRDPPLRFRAGSNTFGYPASREPCDTPAAFIEYNDGRNLDDVPTIASAFPGPRAACRQSHYRRRRPARRKRSRLVAAARHHRGGDHPEVRGQREGIQGRARELRVPRVADRADPRRRHGEWRVQASGGCVVRR